jgi:predicted lysophospholipase L1 biosynthesis ABC-type transport system permease subunit
MTRGSVSIALFLGGFGGGAFPDVSGTLDVPASAVDRYAPAGAGRGATTLLPPMIVEPGAVTSDGTFPVTHVAVLTDGSAAAVERARTILEVAMPTSVVQTAIETETDASATITELGRVVSLGVFGAMLLAGASLAIAVTTGLVERQRPFALLRLSGMPLGRLRALLLVEAAAPLIAVAVISAALGSIVAQIVLRAQPGRSVPPPDASVVVLLVVAILGALAVVLTALPLVGRLTSSEATRFE